MNHVIKRREKGTRIFDLAGSWDMTAEELKEEWLRNIESFGWHCQRRERAC
jgi:hypothetical protein